MFIKGIRKYISNPVIGLLPFMLFIILHAIHVDDFCALTISIGFVIIGEVILRACFKSREYSITFYVSGIALLTTLIVWLLTWKNLSLYNTYLIVCEVTIIITFMLLRATKTYIALRFFRQKNSMQKVLLNEFYAAAALIQYGLTLHIFSIMLYRQFVLKQENTYSVDTIAFSIFPLFILLSIGIYQVYRTSTLATKLKKEEWLPIVTEKGEVTGKIAKSVSMNMKNRFLHPVVRVALISNSKVYLQERSKNDILSPKKLDYPFEKYMLFNHEINLSARNSIRQMLGENLDTPLKFVLKYVFENDNTKRLNFLYVINIENEEDIKRSSLMTGKFWTIKQIEESFADEILSECFELEFEYLKNMVLLPSNNGTNQS